MSDFQQDQTANETPAGEARATPFGEFLRHQKRAFEETGKAVDSLLPPGFKEHGSEAGREFISGFKVLFDAVIDGVQKASKDFEETLNRERPASSDAAVSTAKARAVAQEGETPLDFLLRVMRDKREKKAVRMDAAKAAAPYLHARLSSVEVRDDGAGESHDDWVLRKARERGLLPPKVPAQQETPE